MKLTEQQIKTLYNVAHSLLISLIVVDTCALIGKEFPMYELPIFFGFVGIIEGLGFGATWEFGVEENFLRMPSNKWDLINMAISGTLAGISCAYFEPNITFLWISSIVSAIFVIWHIVKMRKTVHERPKINY